MQQSPNLREPDPDQESVWDYPRPPRLERTDRHLRVLHRGHLIAETTSGWRVLETSHPPSYYFPPQDVDFSVLQEASGKRTWCEWKGQARYYDLILDGEIVPKIAWTYPDPTDKFSELADAVAFFSGKVDEAWVDDEQVTPQPGNFYGGWITSGVTGPFKGEPGTGHW